MKVSLTLNTFRDLYGAIGFPLRLSRTVVVGKKQDVVNRVLYILSYFIRCSEMVGNREQRVDETEDEEDVFMDEELDKEEERYLAESEMMAIPESMINSETDIEGTPTIFSGVISLEEHMTDSVETLTCRSGSTVMSADSTSLKERLIGSPSQTSALTEESLTDEPSESDFIVNCSCPTNTNKHSESGSIVNCSCPANTNKRSESGSIVNCSCPTNTNKPSESDSIVNCSCPTHTNNPSESDSIVNCSCPTNKDEPSSNVNTQHIGNLDKRTISVENKTVLPGLSQTSSTYTPAISNTSDCVTEHVGVPGSCVNDIKQSDDTAVALDANNDETTETDNVPVTQRIAECKPEAMCSISRPELVHNGVEVATCVLPRTDLVHNGTSSLLTSDVNTSNIFEFSHSEVETLQLVTQDSISATENTSQQDTVSLEKDNYKDVKSAKSVVCDVDHQSLEGDTEVRCQLSPTRIVESPRMENVRFVGRMSVADDVTGGGWPPGMLPSGQVKGTWPSIESTTPPTQHINDKAFADDSGVFFTDLTHSDSKEKLNSNSPAATQDSVKYKCDSDGHTDHEQSAGTPSTGTEAVKMAAKTVPTQPPVKVVRKVIFERTNSMFDQYFSDSDESVNTDLPDVTTDDSAQNNQTKDEISYNRMDSMDSIEGCSSIFDEYLNIPCPDIGEELTQANKESANRSFMRMFSNESTTSMFDEYFEDNELLLGDEAANLNEFEDLEDIQQRSALPDTLLIGRVKRPSGQTKVVRQMSNQSTLPPGRCRPVTPTELGRRRHTSALSTASSTTDFFSNLKEVDMPRLVIRHSLLVIS